MRKREDILSNEFSRKEIIKHIVHDGLQTFFTPFDLVEKMLPEDLKGTVRVFFNLEFLEVLMSRKYDMKKVQYVGDTEEKVAFSEIYGVESVLIGKEDWDKILKNQKDIKEFFVGYKMNQAADVTFSNPPYNDNIDLKIVLFLNNSGLLKKIICVHPSTWLVTTKTQLGEKTGDSLYRKFRNLVSFYLESVEFFNGNSVFDILLFVPCIISTIDFSVKQRLIKVREISSKERKVSSIDEITLHTNKWSIVKDFILKISDYVKKNDSLRKYVFVKDITTNDKKYVQLAQTRGNVDKVSMVGKDFYTLVSNDDSFHKGIEECSSRAQIYSFDSENEQNNFLKYLRTDFARLCLSIAKINQGMGRFELYFVPWLDFTQSWDDDKLFSFFGYSKGHPIREYAKTFLPDYHKLYPNGKTY